MIPFKKIHKQNYDVRNQDRSNLWLGREMMNNDYRGTIRRFRGTVSPNPFPDLDTYYTGMVILQENSSGSTLDELCAFYYVYHLSTINRLLLKRVNTIFRAGGMYFHVNLLITFNDFPILQRCKSNTHLEETIL